MIIKESAFPEIIFLACLWIAWCSLHSYLLSGQAHQTAKRFLGKNDWIYRILYDLVSILTLLPVLWYQFTLPQHPVLEANLFIYLVQGALLLYGMLMFYLGARAYDMSYFLGIAQWRTAKENKEPVPLPFQTDGVLAWVRHPWYSGGIAFIWGFGSITDIYLLTRLILTAYFIIGTVHEESRLIRELGDQYRAYRRKVPMLFPWKGKR